MIDSAYALEHHRMRYLWRRRVLVILLSALAAGTWSTLLLSTIEEQRRVSVFGGEGSQVEIPVPTPQEDKPVTVEIQPGRVVRIPDPIRETRTEPDNPFAPYLPGLGVRINWLLVILNIGVPFGLIAWGAKRGWLACEARAREVNFGVFKGSMPYEAHAARREVFRHSAPRKPLFRRVVPMMRIASFQRVA